MLLHLTQFGWKDNSSNSNSETGQRPNILTLYYFLEIFLKEVDANISVYQCFSMVLFVYAFGLKWTELFYAFL